MSLREDVHVSLENRPIGNCFLPRHHLLKPTRLCLLSFISSENKSNYCLLRFSSSTPTPSTATTHNIPLITSSIDPILSLQILEAQKFINPSLSPTTAYSPVNGQFFNDLCLALGESELRFVLMHFRDNETPLPMIRFWDSKNIKKHGEFMGNHSNFPL